MSGCAYEIAEPALPCKDLAGVSFAADILPLLDFHCNGCHAGGAPAAGLNLENHSEVAKSVLEGNLLERLSLPVSDMRMMPRGGEPLPECDISLFQVWTAEGAPNN